MSLQGEPCRFGTVLLRAPRFGAHCSRGQSWLRADRQEGILHIRAGLNSGSNIGTIDHMTAIEKILNQMRREPANVRFTDLMNVCQRYFGKPRQTGTSHAIFKTPWQGDPRINIQDDKGKAKAYQVRQVILAIDKLEDVSRER